VATTLACEKWNEVRNALLALGDATSVLVVLARIAAEYEQLHARPARTDYGCRSDRVTHLKFMRTLWVCNVAGGPQQYAATKQGSTPLGLEEAHRELKTSPAEFDEVAAELGRTLDFCKVPEREKSEVIAAFAAHKGEVTKGYFG
jgi:hypothetical protein